MKELTKLGKIVDMPHYVSYGETDAMGVLYYAEYLHICERARGYISRELGFSYNQLEKEKQLFLPVREAEMRYRSPIRYDDLIYVRTAVTELKKASIRFGYQILNEDKTLLLSEGSTLHAVVNSDGKIMPVPMELSQFFLN